MAEAARPALRERSDGEDNAGRHRSSHWGAKLPVSASPLPAQKQPTCKRGRLLGARARPLLLSDTAHTAMSASGSADAWMPWSEPLAAPLGEKNALPPRVGQLATSGIHARPSQTHQPNHDTSELRTQLASCQSDLAAEKARNRQLALQVESHVAEQQGLREQLEDAICKANEASESARLELSARESALEMMETLELECLRQKEELEASKTQTDHATQRISSLESELASVKASASKHVVDIEKNHLEAMQELQAKLKAANDQLAAEKAKVATVQAELEDDKLFVTPAPPRVATRTFKTGLETPTQEDLLLFATPQAIDIVTPTTTKPLATHFETIREEESDFEPSPTMNTPLDTVNNEQLSDSASDIDPNFSPVQSPDKPVIGSFIPESRGTLQSAQSEHVLQPCGLKTAEVNICAEDSSLSGSVLETITNAADNAVDVVNDERSATLENTVSMLKLALTEEQTRTSASELLVAAAESACEKMRADKNALESRLAMCMEQSRQEKLELANTISTQATSIQDAQNCFDSQTADLKTQLLEAQNAATAAKNKALADNSELEARISQLANSKEQEALRYDTELKQVQTSAAVFVAARLQAGVDFVENLEGKLNSEIASTRQQAKEEIEKTKAELAKTLAELQIQKEAASRAMEESAALHACKQQAEDERARLLDEIQLQRQQLAKCESKSRSNLDTLEKDLLAANRAHAEEVASIRAEAEASTNTIQVQLNEMTKQSMEASNMHRQQLDAKSNELQKAVAKADQIKSTADGVIANMGRQIDDRQQKLEEANNKVVSLTDSIHGMKNEMRDIKAAAQAGASKSIAQLRAAKDEAIASLEKSLSMANCQASQHKEQQVYMSQLWVSKLKAAYNEHNLATHRIAQLDTALDEAVTSLCLNNALYESDFHAINMELGWTKEDLEAQISELKYCAEYISIVEDDLRKCQEDCEFWEQKTIHRELELTSLEEQSNLVQISMQNRVQELEQKLAEETHKSHDLHTQLKTVLQDQELRSTQPCIQCQTLQMQVDAALAAARDAVEERARMKSDMEAVVADEMTRIMHDANKTVRMVFQCWNNGCSQLKKELQDKQARDQKTVCAAWSGMQNRLRLESVIAG